MFELTDAAADQRLQQAAVIAHLDGLFGNGFAARHPRLVAASMRGLSESSPPAAAISAETRG